MNSIIIGIRRHTIGEGERVVILGAIKYLLADDDNELAPEFVWLLNFIYTALENG